MHILFCNNSFPGPFEALARLFALNPEHSVFFASSYGRRDFSINGVRRLVLNGAYERAQKGKDELLRQWTQPVAVGRAARKAFEQLGSSGFAPDMVLFGAGCGEGLFVQSAFANAFRVAYLDMDKLALEGENKTLAELTQGAALFHAHAAFAFGSAQNLPALLRPVLSVIPPFVDTAFFSPEQAGDFCLDGMDGRVFSREAELISIDMMGYGNGQNDPLPLTLASVLQMRPKCHILLTCFHAACPISGAVAALAGAFPGRVHTMTLARRTPYRDMLVAATVRILPGTKNRLRDLLEPMSCGTLLLAQPFSEGKVLAPGRTMLAWPKSAQEQIRLLNEVLGNRQAVETLRQNGRKAVQAEHDQEKVLARHVAELMTAYHRWRGGACG